MNALRIVKRVGRRYLMSCGCGNYFLSGPEIAVCDHCGAEATVSKLAAGRRYQDQPL